MSGQTQLRSAFIALLLLAVGCDSNYLETQPQGSVSSATFWETEEDARVAVNDLYNYLYDTDIFMWDAMSDIATANKPFTTGSPNPAPYQRSTHTAQDGYGNAQWARGYRGIRGANDLLVNVENIETDEQELINRFKAEARFIRAYLYAHLAFWFGDVPLVKEPVSLQEAREVTRTERGQVWDFVVSELQAVSEILPQSYSSEELGRITRGAALAMKSRVLLYAGRYEEAYQAAEAVMGLGEYSLYSSYQDLFSYEAEHNSEVILNKNFITNDYSNAAFAILAPFSQGNARSNYVPTKKMVDAYEMENGLSIDAPDNGFDPRNPYQNRDPRLGYSIFVLGDALPNGQTYDPRPGFGGSDDIASAVRTTNTGFNIQKYVNPEDLPDPFNCGINIILIRYAEVLLNYAEAKIEAGSIDESVYDAINQIRQRPDVDMPPIESGKTQDELRQIVRHERMVELAFEGQRFFDVRRWRIADEVLTDRIYGMTYVNEDGELETVRFTEFQRNFREERDYLWPLPQKEIDITGLAQNPGY